MKKSLFSLLVITLLSLLSSACSSSDGASAGAYPSDEQVIRDATPKNKKGLVDVQVVDGKHGEAYFHSQDLAWYWDRGVVIKRKANIAEAPNAIVVVGGLARYKKMGDQYKYARFLTTYNSYEGIAEPDVDQLLRFVRGNLKEVFVSRDHTITEISKVALNEEQPWVWHTPNSFTVSFTFRYKQIANNTRIDEREDIVAIRFYRNSIDAPIHALMATEKDRKVLGSETFSADEVSKVKTLRTAFK